MSKEVFAIQLWLIIFILIFCQWIFTLIKPRTTKRRKIVKNILPLIVAVLLGVAAVFAVSKTLKKQDRPVERSRYVVIVTGEIAEGELIPETRIGVKAVPESAAPLNCIDERNKAITYNQRAKRLIAKGDYLLYTDIELDQSKSRALGDGQWGVPVAFSDSMMLRFLQPGDDIAIVGTFKYKETIKQSKDANAEPIVREKTVTAVVYPRVSILDIQSGTVLLSMPPQQAVALTAIQKQAKLFPILRKKKDNNALSRKDGGMFEDSAMTDMVKGLHSIGIPEVPAEYQGARNTEEPQATK